MIVSYVILLCLGMLSFNEMFIKHDAIVKQIMGPLIMMVMAFLCLIRGGYAGDYITYKEVFEVVVDLTDWFQPMNFFYEPLYSILQLCAKSLIDDFQFFCLVIGSLVIVLQYKFAIDYTPEKNRVVELDGSSLYRNVKKGKYFFTVFFVLWGLYHANIITTRSNIALCICLYATKYIENRDFKHFVLTTVIAFGFHYSAAVFFPAYYIFRVHCSMGKKIVILVAFSILLSMGMEYVAGTFAEIVGGQLGEKIFSYVDSTGDFLQGTGMEGTSNGLLLLIKAIVNIGLLLVVGLYLWQYNSEDRSYEGYLNLYLIGCILYIATLNINYAFARLSIYYNIFQVPMILYLVSRGKYKENNRMIYWLILFVYILFRFAINSMGMEIKYYWE